MYNGGLRVEDLSVIVRIICVVSACPPEERSIKSYCNTVVFQWIFGWNSIDIHGSRHYVII